MRHVSRMIALRCLETVHKGPVNSFYFFRLYISAVFNVNVVSNLVPLSVRPYIRMQ